MGLPVRSHGAIESVKEPRNRLIVGLLIFASCLSCVALSIARGPAPPELGNTTELYALLARSFLAGKTRMPIEPKPEILALPDPYDPHANFNYRLHDASLYKGHYYFYFGPVPAIALFVPYRLVTGRDLANRVAVPILAIAGYLSSCGLFFSITRRNHWDLPLWLQCVAVVSLCSMSFICFLVRKPIFYQVAVAGAYYFVMAGFLMLGKAMFDGRATRTWFLFAGLSFGLAVGCRPHMVVVCAIVVVSVAIHERSSLRLLIPLVSLMAVVAVALGWYNYVRFDRVMEFGTTYQLSSFVSAPRNVDASVRALSMFLFEMPSVDLTFPFFHPAAASPLPGPVIWTEDMAGIAPAAVFALLGFLAPFFLRAQVFHKVVLDRVSVWLLLTIYWSALAVFLFLCINNRVTGRYLVDFVPLFTLEGVLTITVLWQAFSATSGRGVLRWGVSAAAVYGVLVNVALATPRLDRIAGLFHR